jgi:O-antigen ligase
VIPWLVIASVSLGASLAVLGFAANLPQFAVNVTPAALAYKRGTGTATDPNMFSLMVLFALPLIAHMFFHAKTTARRLGTLALFAVNVMGVVATYSRSGVLVLLFVIGLICVQHARRVRARQAGFLMLGIALAVAAAVVLAPSSYWDRVKSTFDPRSPSIHARLGYLNVGADELKRKPVLGIGIGSFADAYARSPFAASSPYRFTAESARRAAHNTYVEVLVGAGVVGLGLFLAMLGVALRNYALAVRQLAARGAEEMVSLVRAYRLSFLAILADLLTLSRLSHKYIWMALALSQAALFLSVEAGDGQSDDESRSCE